MGGCLQPLGLPGRVRKDPKGRSFRAAPRQTEGIPLGKVGISHLLLRLLRLPPGPTRKGVPGDSHVLCPNRVRCWELTNGRDGPGAILKAELGRLWRRHQPCLLLFSGHILVAMRPSEVTAGWPLLCSYEDTCAQASGVCGAEGRGMGPEHRASLCPPCPGPQNSPTLWAPASSQPGMAWQAMGEGRGQGLVPPAWGLRCSCESPAHSP